MNFNAKKVNLVLIVLILSVLWFNLRLINNRFGSIKIKPTEAAIATNVSGWAWSDYSGWISLNSDNLKCDVNPKDGLVDKIPPIPSQCQLPGSPYPSYGVIINPTTKTMTGSAWSDNVGWISFNNISNCPSAPSGPCGASVVQDGANYRLKGWARLLGMVNSSYGGWVALGCYNSPTEYNCPAGVNLLKVSINPTNGKMSGWAYSNDIGWISFSDTSTNHPSPSPGYGVTTTAFQSTQLTANNSSVNAGEPVNLTWNSSGTSCSGSGGTFAPSGTSGSQIVNPIITTTYTLNCTGPGLLETASVTINVGVAGGAGAGTGVNTWREIAP